MQESFDLVVIGGGPGGYTGAIRGAQLGMKVACIDNRSTLGGTCLNVGCIPSKFLLHASKKYEDIKAGFNDLGINVGETKLNLLDMLNSKNKKIQELGSGISGLFKKNKVSHFVGTGKIISNNEISVLTSSGVNSIYAKNILIATGSEVASLAGITIDEEHIVSSTGALSIKSVPRKMLVIGGGYIGLELGSVWRRLGAEVIIVERGNRIASAMDHELGNLTQQALSKQGIKFKFHTKIISAVVKNKTVDVVLQSDNGNNTQEEKINVDVVLISVGRKPYIKNLGLENVGVKLDKQLSTIEVNEKFATNINNIYAIGDVIRGPMLAHKAEEEAIAAVEIIAGQAGHVNYNVIPSVIYTFPEVASVGYTEEQLKELGIQYVTGKFPFLANSRAKVIYNDTTGMVKVLACAKTDSILGVHIIGPDAGTLIAEAAIAMEFHAAAEDIARTCHAHPTLNEALKEAALAVDKRSINY
ncbi:dihydrolipoyl dehydrogenase [Orientia chuto str. Dubai]|uniref:Dihydrolipoyl dehydrogenase n=1 Tax=Orientia chuto str. Dubai TaxID=1359168 RepID=A0A0F3MKL4_9RICK|nr:dihydrolipoyl dehydrogenase [Candidatus Orientia mediorientalis]KJV56285.1 dihydrolipoyl dehydrogenase [Orientia chuto str. Dubai]